MIALRMLTKLSFKMLELPLSWEVLWALEELLGQIYRLYIVMKDTPKLLGLLAVKFGNNLGDVGLFFFFEAKLTYHVSKEHVRLVCQVIFF